MHLYPLFIMFIINSFSKKDTKYSQNIKTRVRTTRKRVEETVATGDEGEHGGVGKVSGSRSAINLCTNQRMKKRKQTRREEVKKTS